MMTNDGRMWQSAGRAGRCCALVLVVSAGFLLPGCSEKEEVPESARAAMRDAEVPPVESGGVASGGMENPVLGGGGASGPATTEDGRVAAAGLTFEVPDQWQSETPSNQMRAAQFRVGEGEGADRMEVVIYSMGIGGGVEGNISRWIGQVAEPTGAPERMTREAGSLEIHEVRVTGTYSTGMMGSGAPTPETTLLGAVITGGPRGDVFIKATGPQAVASGALDAWVAFLESAKPAM